MLPQLLWFTQIPPSLHSPVKNVSLIAIHPSSSNWNCFHVTIMNKRHKDTLLVKREGLFFPIFHDVFAEFDIVSHTLSVLRLFNFSFPLSGIFACLGLLLPLCPQHFGISAPFSLSVCGLTSSTVCACLTHNYLYFWTWTIFNSSPLSFLMPLFNFHSWMTLK